MSGPGIIPKETVYGGDGWSRTLTFKQGGTAVDLTAIADAWTAQWRPAPGSNRAVDITVDITNAATGVLVLSLTGAQTESLGGDGVWDLQSTLGSADPITRVRQELGWTQDVTRGA